MQFHHWVSIKRLEALVDQNYPHRSLPLYHFGALVQTKYHGLLAHSITRIQYSYCPVCAKTTKDYGGKKNNYHKNGTLVSDVWRDVEYDLNGDLTGLIERFADLFSVDNHASLYVLDLRSMSSCRAELKKISDNKRKPDPNSIPEQINNSILFGDCLEHLQKIPDNSVDFIFADPPYNLKKKYNNYTDNLEISEYYDWCDEWLDELARILKPGRTCAILNIPVRAIRHFIHLEKKLFFQNWISWDALSFPVRKIMPANYSIICFTKGQPRPLPGVVEENREISSSFLTDIFHPLKPMGELYCRRKKCLEARNSNNINDRGLLTDLWWDIHRLRHNSRRVDHPTQLPPQLMYRLISIFTYSDEVVLDCFNGAGTTTLAAHQLNRNYIGIENSEKYVELAQNRHNEIDLNLDPFRKVDRALPEKNNGSRRLGQQKYEVPKKELQLEVRQITEELGHLPDRAELAEHTQHKIEYYDQYFSSWGEIYAAARTTGMCESRDTANNTAHGPRQAPLFEMISSDSSNEESDSSN